MKNKRTFALLIAALMLFSFAACGQDEPAAQSASNVSDDYVNASADAGTEPVNGNESVVITDMIGREVEVVPGSYKRVVCIGAGALRMFSYVADVELLCGVEDIDNLSLSDRPKMFDSSARPYILAYGDVFSKLPSCGVGGPNAQTAEAEKILSCDPDIVISEFEDVDKENALQEQLGIPVITLRTGQAGVFGDEFKGSINLIGQIFEEEDRAEELIGFVSAQAEDIRRRTSEIKEEEKPGVYICGLGNWGTSNHLMTSQKYRSFVECNIKNVITGLEKDGMQPIEEEMFAEIGADTDIIIFDAAAVKNIKPLYAEDPSMFDTCKAWTDGQAYLQMAYNVYYTNYEIALMNAWYSVKVVYPELFEDIDMTDKTNEITKAFLGKELAEEIFACPSSFGGYRKINTSEFFY